MAERRVLDSWKEIAAYLGRSIKTCKKWETRLGLPARRLDESSKARVFAFADELDDWKTKRLSADRHRPPDAAVPGNGSASKSRRRLRFAAAGGILAAAAVAAGVFLLRTDRPPGMRSIAVLPFTDMSPDKAFGFLCDGITETVINALTAVEGLHVPARTSAFVFKERPRDIREIGAKLGVDTILEAGVQVSGETIRVTVQLVDCRTGYHLWSRQYDGPMSEIFAVQDDIARSIVGALDVQDAGAKILVKTATRSREAYEEYLRGRYYLDQRKLDEAVVRFRAALDKDPLMAEAYAGLAAAYNLYGTNLMMPQRDVIPLAEEAALRALEIDPGNAEAHAIRGDVYAHYEWDFDAAEKEFRKAIVSNPSFATAHHWYAFMLAQAGRCDEAVREIETARSLDPLAPRIQANLGCILLFCRRLDRAEAELKALIRLHPTERAPRIYLSEVYAAGGRYGEAVEIVRGTISPDSKGTFVRMLHVLFLALWGKREEAEREFDAVLELSKDHYTSPSLLGAVYGALGDMDRAFDLIEKALAVRDYDATWLGIAPEYDHLHADPRFAALLRKYGLPRPWQAPIFGGPRGK